MRCPGVNASGSLSLYCGRMLEVPSKASSWCSSWPSLWPGISVQVHRCPDRCVMACNSVWERNGGRVETECWAVEQGLKIWCGSVWACFTHVDWFHAGLDPLNLIRCFFIFLTNLHCTLTIPKVKRCFATQNNGTYLQVKLSLRKSALWIYTVKSTDIFTKTDHFYSINKSWLM